MENPFAKKVFSEQFREKGIPTNEDIELAKEQNTLSDLNKATYVEKEKQKNYRQEYLAIKRKRDKIKKQKRKPKQTTRGGVYKIDLCVKVKQSLVF